ncbi:O-antigen ligase family protein [Profundibacter sp.]
MWESGLGRLLHSLFTGFWTLVLGAFAGVVAAIGGTKSVVIVPGLVFAYIMVMTPYSGLYAIVATTPVNVEIAGPITVSRLAILLGAMAVYIQAIKGQIPFPKATIWPEGILALAFFIWIIIATLGAGGGHLVAKIGPFFIFAVIFFVVLNYGDKLSRIHNLFILLATVGLLQAMLVLSEALIGFSPFGGWHATLSAAQGDGEVRVVGTSSHPIILAGFFQVALGALVVLVFWAKSNIQRLYWIGSICVVIAGWWFTYSRSSWIGMAAMLFVGMLLSSRASRKLAIIGGVSGFVILSIFDFSPSALIRYIEDFGSLSAVTSSAGLSAASESLDWRTENWAGAWRIFLANPVFGVGLDASKGQMLAHLPAGAIAHQYISPEVPHNMFLLILAETGLISFLLFIALWIMAFRSLFRVGSNPKYRPYAIALAAIMVGQITTFFFNPLPREIWLTMGMSLALGRVFRMSRHSATTAGITPVCDSLNMAPDQEPHQTRPKTALRRKHQRKSRAPTVT